MTSDLRNVQFSHFVDGDSTMADIGEIKDGLYYSEDHEWTKVDGDSVIVGITDHAQNALHEITYVEVPEVGAVVKAGGECGLIESMKASSEVFSPLSGEVLEVNATLEDAPELVNESPYDKGWIYRLKPTNLDTELAKLMDASAYRKFLESL
jgi:glycine cleavage system H protein